MKQFIIKYKLFSMPFYYEFSVYAESGSHAITAFLKEYPIGIEKYYVSAALSI